MGGDMVDGGTLRRLMTVLEIGIEEVTAPAHAVSSRSYPNAVALPSLSVLFHFHGVTQSFKSSLEFGSPSPVAITCYLGFSRWVPSTVCWRVVLQNSLPFFGPTQNRLRLHSGRSRACTPVFSSIGFSVWFIASPLPPNRPHSYGSSTVEVRLAFFFLILLCCSG